MSSLTLTRITVILLGCLLRGSNGVDDDDENDEGSDASLKSEASSQDNSFDGYIILYVFLGVLGGIALIIVFYKLCTFSNEMRPKRQESDFINAPDYMDFIAKTPLATPTRRHSAFDFPMLQVAQAAPQFGSAVDLSAAPLSAVNPGAMTTSRSFQDPIVFSDPLRGDGYLPPMTPAAGSPMEI